MIELAPISIEKARAYLAEHSKFRGEFNLAICASGVIENTPGCSEIHGVIVLKVDGDTFALGHISTDGNAQVGSLLYGAAWRVAKALGYKAIDKI